MTPIKEMNKDVRRNSATWAAVAALFTAIGIAPQAIVDATGGEVTDTFAWGLLVAVFGGLAMLLEAMDVGRSTPHRSKVNAQIAQLVIAETCPEEKCAQLPAPNKTTSSAATTVFYKLIDIPSREVAFNYWGWYYTALHWIGFAALGMVIVIATWPFISTDFPALRGTCLALLLIMLLVALKVRHTWAVKTLSLSRNQVQQISSCLPGKLPGVDCPNASCPLR